LEPVPGGVELLLPLHAAKTPAANSNTVNMPIDFFML
jgi:hypothetical protein